MPKLKPYPKYKPSNIQWLGDIPQHWSATRLKYLATINDEALSDTTEPSQELHYVDIGSVHPTKGITEIQEIDFENAPSRARRIVRRGDVIVSTVRTYLRAIAPIKIDDPNLIVSTGFAVIRPERLDEGFAAYALQASHFVEQVVANSVGVSYPAINATEMAGFPIPHPSIPEQRAIADYLDHQTYLMDSLVAKKKRMIELLAERRQSIITHAVTKGLAPQAPTRTEPMIRLHHLISVNSGARIPFYPEDEHSAVSIGGEHIQKHQFSLGDKTRFVPLSFYLDQKSGHIQHGDTLVVKDGATIGKSMFVDHMPAEHMMVNEHVFVLRAVSIDPRYLSFLIQSKTTQDTIWSLNVAAAQPGLSKDFVKFVRVPVADLKEQRAIADYLDRETAIMDALTEKLNRQIELLAERRQSLITHAVTGKIDVTESKL